MTALVVASSALLLLVAVVTLAAHDIVGKAKQYEAYVIALSNRAAAAHKSATASLANSKLASQVMVGRSGGDLLANSMGDFSLGQLWRARTRYACLSLALRTHAHPRRRHCCCERDAAPARVLR